MSSRPAQINVIFIRVSRMEKRQWTIDGLIKGNWGKNLRGDYTYPLWHWLSNVESLCDIRKKNFLWDYKILLKIGNRNIWREPRGVRLFNCKSWSSRWQKHPPLQRYHIEPHCRNYNTLCTPEVYISTPSDFPTAEPKISALLNLKL